MKINKFKELCVYELKYYRKRLAGLIVDWELDIRDNQPVFNKQKVLVLCSI
jgi:hypothetical protein